jgi:hypothetical protein
MTSPSARRRVAVAIANRCLLLRCRRAGARRHSVGHLPHFCLLVEKHLLTLTEDNLHAEGLCVVATGRADRCLPCAEKAVPDPVVGYRPFSRKVISYRIW